VVEGERAGQVENLRPIAAELGCSLAQLAIAWCLSRPNVSTVMLGAKTIKQLQENLDAFHVADKITPEIQEKIEATIPFTYKAPTRDYLFMIRKAFL
jgi:aryl-alcohol dehydrogenase-like predicted oxidoreductase